MAVEIENLGHPDKFSLAETLRRLGGLSQEEQWAMVAQGFGRAANLVRQGDPIMLVLVDKTPAGGTHAVRALYVPKEGRALVEIPEEPQEREGQQKGGRFPTVLHTLEVIVGTVGLANRNKPFNPNGDTIYPQQEIPFPDVDFVPTLNGRHANMIVFPLTVDPQSTNLVMFHPQARHIGPEPLAQAYYRAIQGDPELPGDMLRHTMLVQAENNGSGGKNEVGLSVVPKAESRKFRLMHTGRVTGFGKGATENITVRRLGLA